MKKLRIAVKAKPRSKVNKVERIDELHYIVSVKEPPIDGRANVAIIAALAEYFDVPKSFVSMVSGYVGREKVVEIII